jgi:cell division protease FtsH
MNEGAILAARENRKKIAQYDLVRSIEKVMMGPERKSHLMTAHEKDIVAYHEAGHALVASVLPDADPVHKISIIARGSAGGFTMKLPLVEKRLHTSKEFLDDLAMSMGGYAAEKLVFGDITTGPSGDLQTSANLARAMVTKWGMSDRVGPVAFQHELEYSEKIRDAIDSEVERIMKEARERATSVLFEHRKVLDIIAKKLIEVETLEQSEYENILSAHGIPLKKKSE